MTFKDRKLHSIVIVGILLLAVMILQAGCSEKETGDTEAGFPMTITDDLDRQVTIKKEPQRIVSLAPAITEILFALDLGDRVVGVTEYCDYPAEAREKPKIGGFSKPNAELVVAAKPDLVLGTSMHKQFINQLESAGLKAVVLEGNKLNQVLENIKLTGKITGARQKAEELVSSMQDRIDNVVSKVESISAAEKPAVYFEIWPDPLTTGGKNSIVNNLISTAGGKNIAAGADKDWLTLNPEVVLAKNPEVIILSYHGASRQTLQQVKKRDGWEQVAAVKKERVYSIKNQDIVQLAGPRIVEGLEAVAACIHPELFNKQ